MKDIIPAKKQSPILGLTGMGGGVGSNLGGSAAEGTYIDDVFSTDVFIGNQTARSIVNGIDLAGEGGMVWVKNRETAGQNWRVGDTVRGGGKMLYTSNDLGSSTGSVNEIASFGSDGFNVGSDAAVNQSTKGIASWTFRKQKGFFDVVTFQQSGADSQTTPQVVPHNLGVAPGMILLKKINGDRDWFVYHRDLGKDYWMKLNSGGAAVNENNSWGTTTPDANNFGYMSGYIGGGGSSAQFVAYLFGGGASTAATARGVRFDGSDDYLSVGASSDFDMGTGDFTIECWLNRDDTSNNSAWTLGSYENGMELYCYNDDSLRLYGNNGGGSNWLIQSAANVINPKEWNHVAVVRDSGTLKLFLNGTLLGSTAHSSAMPNNGETTDLFIGVEMSSGNTIPGTSPYFDGEISNFRVVKGTAVYTSSFRPPYEPLTNITNTKLLCCNNSSVTGSTVTPATITAHSAPTASTDSPFDDPEGFKFGSEGDQNIIKTGVFTGNGNSVGPDINLGFEPQWVMVKRTDSSANWLMWDTMRGIYTGTTQSDPMLFPDLTDSETTSIYRMDLTSRGFKITSNNAAINQNGGKYAYIAIRRPDSLVAKPAEAGTDVFTMDTGSGSSTIPEFDSAFPVDFALMRQPGSTENWFTGARLTGGKYMNTNRTVAENNTIETNWVFDSNAGWCKNYNSDYQSWMWKRHAGFDVVTTNNLPFGANIPHSLGKTPEMIIGKNRNNTFVWGVYHKGVNGGTNPEQYRLQLNGTDAQAQVTEAWNNTAPTATHFTVGANHTGNSGGADYKPIFFLFASVVGISKVGYYDGTGYTGNVITTGFTPRFVIVKCTTTAASWVVWDTTRGVGNFLLLNDSNPQGSASVVTFNSTGFTLTGTSNSSNGSGQKYVYYAHA